MSFNKRYYSIEKITRTYSSSQFDNFDRWICNPDARIFEDDISLFFVEQYLRLETDERLVLGDALLEDASFLRDLLKCMRVTKSEFNKDHHKNCIEKFKILFIKKWEHLAEKYNRLIN